MGHILWARATTPGEGAAKDPRVSVFHLVGFDRRPNKANKTVHLASPASRLVEPPGCDSNKVGGEVRGENIN